MTGAATDTRPSPTRGDKTQTPAPNDRAPLGWTFALYYRRTRAERWREVYRHENAEALWRWSLSMPSGHYREVLVRAGLFDAAEVDER